MLPGEVGGLGGEMLELESGRKDEDKGLVHQSGRCSGKDPAMQCRSGMKSSMSREAGRLGRILPTATGKQVLTMSCS